VRSVCGPRLLLVRRSLASNGSTPTQAALEEAYSCLNNVYASDPEQTPPQAVILVADRAVQVAMSAVIADAQNYDEILDPPPFCEDLIDVGTAKTAGFPLYDCLAHRSPFFSPKRERAAKR